MRGFTLTLAAWLVVPLSSLSARDPLPVEPGARVRVTHDCIASAELRHTTTTTLQRTRTECRTDEGTIETLTDHSVVLVFGDPPRQLAVPLAGVTQLAAHRGRKSHTALGAGIGFVTGAVAGAVAGAIAQAMYTGSDELPYWYFGGVYAGILAPTGLVFGTVIGAMTRTDRWEQVPLDHLRLEVARQRDGALGVRLALRF